MGKRSKVGNKQGARKDFNKEKFGKFKSKKGSAINKNGTASTNPDRKIKEGSEGFYRTKDTIKRLNMYNEKPDLEKRRIRPDKPARIEPNRKWFGNTRTINQKTLENLRTQMENKTHDTYSLLLRKRQIPQSLITPSVITSNINKLHSKFEDTFGPKSRRKKPNLKAYTMDEYADSSNKMVEDYDELKDENLLMLVEKEKNAPETKYIKAGQSKRIYNELHKVIDSSDVLCEILDARDPIGTRSYYAENFIKKNCPHKHIVLILNKCDLVPTWVTAAWIKILSKEYPTLAFHASITNPFGKPALFQILRQFDALHKDKKNISIGFVGYPNVGKSSIINTLKKRQVCKAAPIPGETRVWQYVTLTKRIYLIDCPGVVYEGEQTETEKVLKSVVRAEKLEEPLEYIIGILEKVKKEYLQKLYKVETWVDYEDFVSQIAVNYGKLKKGGEPDTKTMAKMILMDWQRGKIPFFVVPPGFENREEKKEGEIVVEAKEGETATANDNLEEKAFDNNIKFGIAQDLKEIVITNQYDESKKDDK